MQNSLLDFVFPRACVGCGRVGNYICAGCVRKLKPYYVQHCHVCRHEARTGMVHTDCSQRTHLDGVIVCYVYGDLAEKLITMIKYQFCYAAIHDVARLMAAYTEAVELPPGVISYVPAHPYRERWRGFNQAQLLASGVAKLTDRSCAGLVRRSEYLHSQVGQGREGRLESLHRAFAVDAGVCLPGSVILVDDVMTTGNTLEQCARVLKSGGVKSVMGLVFARGWYLPVS